jgi:hypothetical protein
MVTGAEGTFKVAAVGAADPLPGVAVAAAGVAVAGAAVGVAAVELHAETMIPVARMSPSHWLQELRFI